MNPQYKIEDDFKLLSPSLIFHKDLIEENIARVVAMAGSPARLRPHVKTHKTREIVKLSLAAGITRHKCATIAEAEMLAQAGAPDILLAYPLVGPNCQRLARLMKTYAGSRFSTLVDHPVALAALSQVMHEEHLELDLFLDFDVGQHRTGVADSTLARELYVRMCHMPGLKARGFHVYDGHNHQESSAERRHSVLTLIEPVLALRAELQRTGYSVPTIICGGTPTFPIWASLDIPGLECSPGTFVLYDHGYGSKYADLSQLIPAAIMITRVVSRPSPTRITFDLGTKAVASDPPAGKRCVLLNLPEYTAVVHSEEHLVVETLAPNDMVPGDIVYAVPTHICPTCALHRYAYVADKGRIIGTWDIPARDRLLTV